MAQAALDAAFFRGSWVEGKKQAFSVQLATLLKVEILAQQFTFSIEQ